MNNTYYERALEKRDMRKKQVRKNTVILMLVLLIIILLCVFFTATFSSQASDMEHQHYYKYYKSIVIKKGDTLWSIAGEYMDTQHYQGISDYINEVKEMNALTNNQITAGNYLIVPYYSSEFS